MFVKENHLGMNSCQVKRFMSSLFDIYGLDLPVNCLKTTQCKLCFLVSIAGVLVV